MPAESEFVHIELSNDLEISSQWFAERRILYEYPLHDRQVFGKYGSAHIATIQRGIIGEFAVFSYLHEALLEQHGTEDVRTRHRSVSGKLALNITLGGFDSGYDLVVMENTVDVKTYGTRVVERSQLPNFNLLVNQQEVANREAADLYVQVFITTDRHVVLAGYNEGLPPLNTNFPSPAYARRVPDLLPMSNLRQMVLGKA